MKQEFSLKRMLWISLFSCSLLPLGLLAAVTVRTAEQLMVLACTVGLASVFSIWFSHFILERYAMGCQESNSLNAQMVSSEKMANLGRLAADITHELNNPLQLILSQAAWTEELLGDEEPGQVKNLDEYQKSAAGIKQQVARATRITGRVLDYTRQGEEENASVQINALLEETWSFLEKKARDNNIGHVFIFDPTLPSILSKEYQLQQVLLNLMDNAIDALGQGGEIRISTTLVGNRIRIEISDNGPGVPAEVLERIWQPFFTTKDRGKGTGLGLAISQQIVQALGAELSVHNKTGETGAVFTVKIPINPGATISTKQG